jgi:predicted ArsR family transcriptional regulator
MSITTETRREAYEAVQLPEMEAKVYGVLKEYGPQSAEEIMDRLGTQNPNNVRPRLSGLKKKGLVQATAKRQNRHGRNEAVWEVVDQ